MIFFFLNFSMYLYLGEKNWNIRMIRRLFYEIDRDHSGSISMKELTQFVTSSNDSDTNTLTYDPISEKLYTKTTKSHKDVDADDDYDDDLFSMSANKNNGNNGRGINDFELFRKITDILLKLITSKNNSVGMSPEHQLEEVKVNIRKFFQRSDAEHKGYVSEERFRSFLRYIDIQIFRCINVSQLLTYIHTHIHIIL